MVEKKSVNLLKMMSEVCVSEDLTEHQIGLCAEIIYDLLAEQGWSQDPFSLGRSEVHERLMCGCAYVAADWMQGVRAFCSIHDKELVSIGDVEMGCEACEQGAEEAAAEKYEAELYRKIDCIAETDDDSTFEQNYPFYNKEGA